jgi:hypothetical protein
VIGCLKRTVIGDRVLEEEWAQARHLSDGKYCTRK